MTKFLRCLVTASEFYGDTADPHQTICGRHVKDVNDERLGSVPEHIYNLLPSGE